MLQIWLKTVIDIENIIEMNIIRHSWNSYCVILIFYWLLPEICDFSLQNAVLTPKITEVWQILMKTFNYLKSIIEINDTCHLLELYGALCILYLLFPEICVFSLLNALFTPKFTLMLQMWNKMVIYMNTIIKINIFCHLLKTFSLF